MTVSLERLIAAARIAAASIKRRSDSGQGVHIDELELVKAHKRYAKAWPED